MRYCEDCKFFKASWQRGTFGWCLSPKAKIRSINQYIFKVSEKPRVEDEREDGLSCGTSGTNWEKAEPGLWKRIFAWKKHGRQ
jgi:hypothetical protein